MAKWKQFFTIILLSFMLGSILIIPSSPVQAASNCTARGKILHIQDTWSGEHEYVLRVYVRSNTRDRIGRQAWAKGHDVSHAVNWNTKLDESTTNNYIDFWFGTRYIIWYWLRHGSSVGVSYRC